MQVNLSNTRRNQILIGLLLALGVPLLPLGAWGERLSLFGPLVGHETLWWLAAAVMLFCVLRVERRPLSSIGLRRLGLRDILIGVLAGILMFVGAKVINSEIFLRFHLQANMHEAYRIAAAPFWYRFILVLRAAVVEEILFRGYAIERLQELTGSILSAAVISWLTFTVTHLNSWGWAFLIYAGFHGVILTLLYVWRRNLSSNIIAHWVVDAAIYLF
jgi:membrane protease YdiL (CAAX protease family)